MISVWRSRAAGADAQAVSAGACPYGMCDGSGLRYVDPADPDEGVIPCRCVTEKMATKRRFELFENAHVPQLFRDARFDTLDGRNAKQLEAAKAFVERWPRHLGRGFILFGGVGTGKSTLAYAMFNELLNRGVPGIAENGSRLLRDLGHGISRNNLHEQMRMLAEVDLLLIDDLAAHRTATMFATESFYGLVNDRYEAARPTIYTSMIPPQMWTGSSTDLQIQQMWSAIASRILATCESWALEGPDWRMQALKAKPQ